MSAPAFPRRDTPVADHAELRRRLLAAVRRHCPPWLRDEADDIVQQAMIRVTSSEVTTVNSTYIDRLAYCATIDEIRRRRARRMVITEEPPEVPSAAPGDHPGRVSEDRRVGEAIRDCLAGLVETRRRAVGLYLEGHTVPEVGRILDISTKNAENFVYRGLEDLRACLHGKGMAP